MPNPTSLSSSENPTTPSPDFDSSAQNVATDPAASIAILLAAMESKPKDMLSSIRRLGRMLETVKDHSSDELFTLLKTLKEMEAENRETSEIFSILLMSLASEEPERTLIFLESGVEEKPNRVQQYRMIAFAAWAGSDPEKSGRYLASRDWKESEKMMANKAIIESLASKNLRKALAYCDTSEMHPNMKGVIAAQAARIPERREEAWELLEEDLETNTRNILSGGVLSAIFFESGLAGVTEVLPRMKFDTPDDRDQVLASIVDGGIWNSPGETMSWMQQELSKKALAEKIPDALQKWAIRDVAAAGNWLREQETSPTRNAAISAYATTVAKLDPKGALDWTKEITEQKTQDEAKRKVLTQWHHSDPKAASTWIEEAGLEPAQWLPKD